MTNDLGTAAHSPLADRPADLEVGRQRAGRQPWRLSPERADRLSRDSCNPAGAIPGDGSCGALPSDYPVSTVASDDVAEPASAVTRTPPCARGTAGSPRPASSGPTRATRTLDRSDVLCARIARIIYREAGIVLGAGNSNMILARLEKRIARAGCGDLAGYVRLLESPAGAGLIPDLVTALTTNVTQFFREPHHFDFLRGVVAPRWCRDTDAPLAIWSAGCSSGQEPYSIAMALSPPALSWADAPPLTILATDIDRDVLARAERGEYSQTEAASIPPDLRDAWFRPARAGIRARPGLRGKVEFRPQNLHGRWALPGQFDVIFCRNVIIYFDAAAQHLLWEKFLYHLRPGGWLIVGHSEQAPKALRGRVRQVGPTVYQCADPARTEG